MEKELEILTKKFGKEKVEKAIENVKNFDVEIPSWVFGKFGGGRFGGYIPPGYARNIFEKIDDAEIVYKLTGKGKSILTHVLWDFSLDETNPDEKIVKKVYDYLKKKNLLLGTVSPTYFLGPNSYMGSFTSPLKEVRDYFIKQTLFASNIAKKYGNSVISLWFPDGSLYPGEIELDENYKLMRDTLIEVRKKVSQDVFILIEYKLFEPTTYSTTIPDWATAYILSKKLKNCGILIDLGHHPFGINIEQIAATLIIENIKCGFHFNTRYAADDDQSVEVSPTISRIFYYLLKGDVVFNKNKKWFYALDIAAGRENRIESVINSIESLEICLAKASFVDIEKLKHLQKKYDIICATRYFNEIIVLTDVRPVIYQARKEKKLPLNPIEEYRKTQYQEKIEKERK